MSKRVLPQCKENDSPNKSAADYIHPHIAAQHPNYHTSAACDEECKNNNKKKYKGWDKESLDPNSIQLESTENLTFSSPYLKQPLPLPGKQHNCISIGEIPTESSVTSHDRMNSVIFECNESLDCIQKEEPCISLYQDFIGTHIVNEKRYSINPYYMEKQINIKKYMRSILLDWVMEVCADYHMKRETYYLATNYIDRYLAAVDVVRKDILQLIGVTSLMIASKIEEIWPPKVMDYIKVTDEQYTVAQMNSMEVSILRALKFELCPPTVFMWSNMFMSQWDLYIENNCKRFNVGRVLTFKHSNVDDYKRFREVMQIIDLSSLDIDTFQYNLRILCLTALFLVLAQQYLEYSDEKPRITLPYIISSLKKKCEFNEIFFGFASENWEICQEELTPGICYLYPYTELPYLYDMPANTPKTDSYEDMITFQTHHPKQLEFVRQILANN